MATLDTGLKFRMQRAEHQMRAQHRHLNPFFEEIESALARRDRGPLQGCLERLTEALEAHFDLEDDVLFPALHGLSPDSESEIRQLSRDHSALLDELEKLFDSLRGKELEAFEEGLRHFRSNLRSHEEREEQLVGAMLGAAD